MPDAQRARQIHRVDPRLVHSTLLEAWVPHFEARHVVVADAVTAADPRRKTIFLMSARDVGATHFVPETEVQALLDSLPPDEAVIVAYGSLAGFYDAVQAGLRCARVLIGHIPDGRDRRRLNPSVYVGEEELVWVEKIAAIGVDVVVQPLPIDTPLGLRRGEDERPVLTEDLTTISSDIPSTAVAAVREAWSEAPTLPTEPAEPSAHEAVVEVVNERGLHLRAAHLLAQLSGRFQSQVEVGREGHMVNAKSLLGITTLGASKGSKLDLRVAGPDAGDAFAAVSALFASGFDEGTA